MATAPDLDHWFVRHILPYEASLLRYLKRICPNPADVQDIRHDAYVRILEIASAFTPTAPKALLFKTARNIVIDRARRSRIVPIDLREDLEDLHVLVDEVTPERRVSIRQQLETVIAAFSQLPEKCREALWLKRVEGLTQREIAAELNVSEGTVEKHLARASRLFADRMSTRDAGASAKRTERNAENGVPRGE